MKMISEPMLIAVTSAPLLAIQMLAVVYFMAYYRPDHDAINGEKHLKELKGEKGKLIRYYVQKKDEHIERLNKTIDEMSAVFKGLAKFVR